MMEKLHFSLIETSIGPIGMVASERGLLHIELRCPPEEHFVSEIEKRYHGNFAGGRIQDSPLRIASKEIREYLAGRRSKFSVPLDLRGPEFMVKVCQAMAKIPYGRTVTYGELAGRVGRPKAARAVGRAVGANPLPIIIPCHRVVGAGGKLTGFGSGLDLKAHLLDLEQRSLSRLS